MPAVLVPIANGSEEIESVCIIDTLVRAGCTVTVASVEETTTCKMSRGVTMVADKLIAEAMTTEYDCIVIPGGMPGAKTIGECEPFVAFLKAHVAADKWYGAICAAPAVALKVNGLIPEGAPATCYPAFAEKLGDTHSTERVVTAGKLVTSQGPSTAVEFALVLIEKLVDVAKSKEVGKGMLQPGYLD